LDSVLVNTIKVVATTFLLVAMLVVTIYVATTTLSWVGVLVTTILAVTTSLLASVLVSATPPALQTFS
jgi:hypothetical protein